MPSNEWIEVEEGALVLRVDRHLYSDEAIFRTCYLFTDRCYLFLEQAGIDNLVVRFRRRNTTADLTEIIGAFENELISQRLRVSLGHETAGIRRLIVERAFADANFNEPCT